MDFVRKYIVWVLIGLVILGEVGLMVFAQMKQAQAAKKIEDLERLRRQRDALKAQTRDADEILDLLKKRREHARRELGDALLSLWHRGLAIEGLFEDKRLEAYDVAPGKPPARMDVFRAVYQTVYNDQVAALGEEMTRLETSRAALRLADPSGFQQANVTIDDIFALQKEFKITKALLEILDRAGAKLRGFTLGLSERRRAPEPHVHGKAPEVPGVLVDPIPVQFTVELEYPRFDGMLEDLLRSPIVFRLKSVAKMAPSSQAAGVARPTPVTAKPRERGESSALAVEPAAARGVSATLVGEVEDLCVEVHKVTFRKPRFPDVAAVSKWLSGEAARLARRKAECVRAKEALAGKPVRSQIAQWVRAELARVRAAAQPPEEGAEAKKPPPGPLTIADRLGEPQGRAYVFATPQEAEEWLLRRCDVELERLAARAELLERLTKALKTPATNAADRTAVVVTFRPLEHFDKKQLFDCVLDAESTVVAQLGLVTYKLQESVEGVRRAASVP